MTSAIDFDATAAEVDTALTALVGAVDVTRSSVTSEGGSTYSVTFTGLTGDVSALVPYYSSSLTGTSSVVKVMTDTQGSAATGTQLKVSFDAAMHCSKSQVPSGACGNAVDSYSLEIGTSSSNRNIILPLTPNYDIQYVRVAANDLMNYKLFDAKKATGTFQLSYNGATSGAINAAASATDVREALESLPDVNTVHVSREYAGEELSYKVSAIVGSTTLSCASGSICNFAIPAGDLIKVGGVWYKVLNTFDFETDNTGTLPLAEVTDSTAPVSFSGTESTSTSIYRWTRGYEWAVTFLDTSGDSVEQLSSPQHSLSPGSTTVSIRASDCAHCAYITGLSVWTNYFLAVRAHNSYGYGDYTTTTATPKEVPGAPTYVQSSSVSGTEINVYFSPPTGDSSDVSQYTVEWDNNADFTNMYDTSLTPSCSTSGYGRCEMTGSTLDGIPPYSYLVQYLTTGTPYYVRVAARNSISISSGMDDENTFWSGVTSSTTSDQAPSAPVLVESLLAGPTQIQVLITEPLSNGGATITDYVIEHCASSAFDDATTYTTTTQAVSGLSLIDSGITVYEITGLTAANSYWVRVSAINSIGTGSTTMTASAVAVASKAGAPASVTLVTETDQSTPITDATLTWTSPTSNGGAAITGYAVEWWEGGFEPEVQLVTFESTQYFTGSYSATDWKPFKLTYAPTTSSADSETTADMPMLIHEYNLRSALMNLGQEGGSYSDNNVIGHVEVSKTTITNAGYSWRVTFLDSINRGDLVSLQISSDATALASHGVSVSVDTITDGRRELGNDEVQIISVLSKGSTAATDLGGFFQLSFNGTETTTHHLSADASDTEVERALEQLASLRGLTVTRSTVTPTINSINYAGYEWSVTFTDKGNQPAIAIHDDYLTTSATSVTAAVYDGDNSLSSNVKATEAVPGELAVGYNYREVSADTLTFTIPNLVPGTVYYASVSAINAYGIGAATVPSTNSVTPPKQVPEPPTNVALSVHDGSSTSLDVYYDAPASTGGADILNYRIELDTSSDFSNPIYSQVYCSPANTHSVWQITTAGASGGTPAPITSGYFTLDLTFDGNTYTTAEIPYDATAELTDETGVETKVSGVTADLASVCTSGSTCDVTFSAPSANIIFMGDRLKFRDSSGAVETTYENQYWTVTAVVDSASTSAVTVVGSGTANDFITTTFSGADVYRVIGGRGYQGGPGESRVACIDETRSDGLYGGYWNGYFDGYCSVTAAAGADGQSYDRSEFSGSVQSKFHMLSDALTLGVEVDRDDPDSLNGVTWRVTFLDNSPADSLNFDLSVNTNALYAGGVGAGSVTLTELVEGVDYTTDCTGTQQVPTSQALTVGQYYYARVFAKNSEGYSLSQVAASAEKPQVSPGAPTAVTLEVVSDTRLRILFNPPSSTGGDDITSYLIEYSTASDFSTVTSETFTYLDGGSPFQKTVTGLTAGTFYYFRVSAGNSQGYGDTTASTPSSLNPYTAADGPTNVYLRQTSASMLTVAFDAPTNNGGDSITQYRVEWDTASGFNSALSTPHKGYVDVDASLHSSHTIESLTQGQNYYVRVFAINSAGVGASTTSSPAFVAPALQVPGKPHTLLASTGSSSGEIILNWQFPRVPWHTIPCSGTTSSASDCPTETGGGNPSSTGGSSIVEYQVQYNELADFTGYDSGEFTTTYTTYTLNGLTPGRTYYMRVLARNAQGSGSYCAYTDADCIVGTTQATAVAAV